MGVFSSTVFLNSQRTTAHQKDCLEQVHDLFCYPLAYASNSQFTVTQQRQFYPIRNPVNRICALAIKFIACTVLIIPTSLGLMAGRFSKTYTTLFAQHQWRIAKIEQRTFQRAIEIFPPQTIVQIAEQTKGEGGTYLYLDELFKALPGRKDLVDAINESYNHMFIDRCPDLKTFDLLCSRLSDRRKENCTAVFIESRKPEFFDSLTEEELTRIFNLDVCENGEIRKGITCFRARDLLRHLEARSSKFQQMAAEVLKVHISFGFMNSLRNLSAEELQKFCTLMPHHLTPFFRSLPGYLQQEFTPEQKRAIYLGLLEGRVEPMSKEQLDGFYECFSLKATSDEEVTLLQSLLYPPSFKLKGFTLSRAIEALSFNNCLTPAFIEALTEEQYLSIPDKGDLSFEEDRPRLWRSHLPEAVRNKFVKAATK